MRCIVPLLLVGLSMVYAQTDSLNIFWSPNSETDMHSYRLYRAVNNLPFSRYQVIMHPDTYAVDKDVQPGNLYTYYLTAVDSAGNESDPSDTVAAGVPMVGLHLKKVPGGQVTAIGLDTVLYDPDNRVGQLTLIYEDLDHVKVSDSLGVLYIEPDPPDYAGPAGFTMIVIDTMGLWDSTHVKFVFETPILVDNTPPIPPTGLMILVYPNPFTATTTFLISLPEASNMTLLIYDALGREVINRVCYNLPVGKHLEKVDMSSLPSGTYFYRVEACQRHRVGKITLLKQF